MLLPGRNTEAATLFGSDPGTIAGDDETVKPLVTETEIAIEVPGLEFNMADFI